MTSLSPSSASSGVSTATFPRLDLPPNSFSQQRYSYPSSVPSWARPKSPSPSIKSRSSRGNSPAPGPSPLKDDGHVTSEDENDVLALSAGCQPDAVYKAYMPTWRYQLRKILVRGVEWESPRLASIQNATRSPFWDSYFIWSSIFGTHSAFMVGLPIFFWFGNAQHARGLVNILAFGVYSSSVLKDMFCVPRPYTPPVERLSISSHGLEYGFPSTHSTNAVSISLYFAQLYVQSRSAEASAAGISLVDILALGSCALYAISVVAGRIYCGMHSMTDCVAGTLLGTALWYTNMVMTPLYEAFLTKSAPLVLSSIVPLTLGLVFIHPEPVDDCPCFEDAIAFVAVAAGIALGGWDNVTRMHLSPLTAGRFTLDQDKFDQLAIWVAAALAKLIVGIGAILLWRIVAKKALHVILPPAFKFFRPVIDLPRRHYQRATGYQQVEKSKPIHAVPSVLDLTELKSPMVDFHLHNADDMSESNPSSPLTPRTPLTPFTPHSPNSPLSPHAPSTPGYSKSSGRHLNVIGTVSAPPPKIAQPGRLNKKHKAKVEDLHVVHYDIDVLTKVGVYTGIGYIAALAMPALFASVGLDVKH